MKDTAVRAVLEAKLAGRSGSHFNFVAIGALLFLIGSGSVFAQDVQLGVVYTCSGDRMYIESCNIRDTSDSSTCQVAHPDKPKHNGFMAYTTETRGSLKKLLPTCEQPSVADVAKAQAHYKRQNDLQAAAEKKASDDADAIEARAQAVGTGRKPQTPEERAITRCITSGRLAASCTGNALLGAFGQMLSQVLPAGEAQQPSAGPTMAGVFEGQGNWRLDFIDGGVLVNCSFLSPNQESYKMQFDSGRAMVVIGTTPKPLQLTLRADGTITGPGPVTINGVVASGSTGGQSTQGHTETQVVQTRQTVSQADARGHEYDGTLTPAGGGNYERTNTNLQTRNVPGTYAPPQTNFSRRTATCPALTLSSKGASMGVQTMQTDLLKTMLGGDKGPPTPPGIRMHGIFAANTGFSVQFFPESAVLGCGADAARAYPYSVGVEGAGAVVKINASDHPLTLALRPDGSLVPDASGAYQIHGRSIAAQNDNGDYTFAPMEQVCNLSVLTASKEIPSGGAAASAVSTTLASATAPLGNATLTISSGFATAAGARNPLAGRPFVLLRESYAEALAKGGVDVPKGTSPYQYVGKLCAGGSPDCQKAMNAIKQDAAAAVRADANGNGSLPGVAPGTYYLMISTGYNNRSLIWGQAVALKPGSNSIKLDEGNVSTGN